MSKHVSGPKTRERLNTGIRAFLGPRFTGDNALDKLVMTLELVLVERYFPDTLECRVTYRNTVDSQEYDPVTVTAKIMVSNLSDGCQDFWLPPGKWEVDPATKRQSWVPVDEYIVGVVETVGGDVNGGATVLIGYVHMTEEGPIIMGTAQREIQFKTSKILLREDMLRIQHENQITNNITLTGGLIDLSGPHIKLSTPLVTVEGRVEPPHKEGIAMNNASLTAAFGPAAEQDGIIGTYTVTGSDQDYLVTARAGKFRVSKLDTVEE